MEMKLPDIDQGRLAMLRSTVSTGQGDHEAGRFFIGMETLDLARQMHARFYGEHLLLAGATAKRRAAVAAVDAAINELSALSRDLCMTVRWQARRQPATGELLRYFDLPQQGQIQFPTACEEWIEFAARLQRGADAAQARGYAQVANRHLLDEALVRVTQAHHAFTAADAALVAVQAQYALTRAEVDTLLREIYCELCFTLHHKSGSQRHTVLHAYGLRYCYTDEYADGPGAGNAGAVHRGARCDAVALEFIRNFTVNKGASLDEPNSPMLPNNSTFLHTRGTTGNGAAQAA